MDHHHYKYRYHTLEGLDIHPRLHHHCYLSGQHLQSLDNCLYHHELRHYPYHMLLKSCHYHYNPDQSLLHHSPDLSYTIAVAIYIYTGVHIITDVVIVDVQDAVHFGVVFSSRGRRPSTHWGVLH